MTLAERIKEQTQSATSALMQGRDTLDTVELLKYAELTLDSVDLVTTDDGSFYSVVTFDELPDRFYFGGKVLTDIVTAIYNVTESETGYPVKINEPVKVSCTMERSKNGRTYAKWVVH